MTSIKSRLSSARAKLLRRGSTASTASSAKSSPSLRKSISLSRLPKIASADLSKSDVADVSHSQRLTSRSEVLSPSRPEATAGTERDLHNTTSPSPLSLQADSHDNADHPDVHDSSELPDDNISAIPNVRAVCPAVTLEAPTPVHVGIPPPTVSSNNSLQTAANSSNSTSPSLLRRQSLVDPVNARAVTLLDPDIAAAAALESGLPPTALNHLASPDSNFSVAMLHRKIWVKRPNASATLVQIREDDLVDDVREMILKKYGNSLGRSFDAPDILLRILPRDTNHANNANGAKSQDRVLGPEEEMCRTLDAYYPGGQTVSEALIIEVPKPRTPRPSPRVPLYYAHHDDSATHQTEYFPPMPIVNPSPAVSHDPRATLTHAPHSIAVLQTGQLPPLPSPGSTRRPHTSRPKIPRHNTASPTTLSSIPHSSASVRPTNRPRHDSTASESKHAPPANAPLPTPPPAVESVRQNSTPPTPRVASPRPDKKRRKPKPGEPPSLPAGLLDGSVPPINVLIVEDNIINLRVLGAFMQRLKVRWQKAMDGREAVTKWRTGGFHLVLMDIQLPIMDGLEATREIRRLERVNSIGVFSSGSTEAPNTRLAADSNHGKDINEDDKLRDRNLFKSPVIIVALTASSLQSDRHEALAAGCNDFLTKPVNFVWLERKVKEWGCMQALIDFDGWRKWKDFAADSDSTAKPSKLAITRKGRNNTKSPQATTSSNGESPLAANGTATKPKDEEKKSKRRSMGIIPPPSLPEEETPPQGDPES